MGGFDGMDDLAALERQQRQLADLSPPPWHPRPEPLVVGGVFVAFARGEQGPGHAGGVVGRWVRTRAGVRSLAVREERSRRGTTWARRGRGG